jgi:hypothetical protein
LNMNDGNIERDQFASYNESKKLRSESCVKSP